MLCCIPVTWKSGSVVRITLSDVMLPQRPALTRVACNVRWVCMHPLGRPVVPEVYGKQAKSLGPGVCSPGDHTLRLLSLRGERIWRSKVGLHFEVVRVGGDDYVLEVALVSKRGDLGVELLTYNCNLRPGVLDVVPKLFGEVHGVAGDDDSVVPQCGVVGNNKLRAVLHVQDDPIALLDTEVLL